MYLPLQNNTVSLTTSITWYDQVVNCTDALIDLGIHKWHMHYGLYSKTKRNFLFWTNYSFKCTTKLKFSEHSITITKWYFGKRFKMMQRIILSGIKDRLLSLMCFSSKLYSQFTIPCTIYKTTFTCKVFICTELTFDEDNHLELLM